MQSVNFYPSWIISNNTTRIQETLAKPFDFGLYIAENLRKLTLKKIYLIKYENLKGKLICKSFLYNLFKITSSVAHFSKASFRFCKRFHLVSHWPQQIPFHIP